MPARRIKSIMHGSAPSTRVYHREHRSKKGRGNILDLKNSLRFKRKKEEFIAKEMDKEKRRLLIN